jgi:hypothetical protein
MFGWCLTAGYVLALASVKGRSRAGSADVAINWQPTREGWQQVRLRGRSEVAKLSHLCCIVVANHIDSVASLEGLPQLYLVRVSMKRLWPLHHAPQCSSAQDVVACLLASSSCQWRSGRLCFVGNDCIH